MLLNEPSDQRWFPAFTQRPLLFSLMVTAEETDSVVHFSYMDITWRGESLVSQHAVQSQFHHIASPILHFFFNHVEVVCQADAVTEWQWSQVAF